VQQLDDILAHCMAKTKAIHDQTDVQIEAIAKKGGMKFARFLTAETETEIRRVPEAPRRRTQTQRSASWSLNLPR